jgi:hypothetical protein
VEAVEPEAEQAVLAFLVAQAVVVLEEMNLETEPTEPQILAVVVGVAVVVGKQHKHQVLAVRA